MAFSYWRTGNFDGGVFRAPANQGAQGTQRNTGFCGYGYTNYLPGSWGRTGWDKWAWSGSCLRPDTSVSAALTTLDPANRNTNNAQLSNGNLTVTGVNQGAPQAVRTTTEVADGESKYFEARIDTLDASPGFVTIGASDGGFVFATTFNTPAQAGNGAGLGSNGYVYPSVTFGNITEASGGVLQCKIKRTGTTIRVWVGYNNTWVGDPSAETGGETYTLVGGHCYGYVSVNRVDTATARFTAASQSYAAPTGSTAWDTAAANTYSLTAAVGAYSLTGQAVGLVTARRLTASVGSYSLTGTATALRVARRQVEAVGSYTITGTATALRATRRLTAAVGSYALTGTAIGLKKGYNLSAAAGAYSIAGTATSLRVARRQIEAVGIYSISGIATALRVARKLAAAVGSYVLTGTAVGLVYTPAGRVLIATPGAYALTGTAAALRIARKLIASPGSYSLVGSVAGLAAGRKVAANSGTYVLTGGAAALGFGRRLSAAPGSYVLLGTVSTLAIARRLAAESGAYLLIGSDAVLIYGRPAPPAPSRTTTADASLGETSSTGRRTTTADPLRSSRADGGRITYADKRAA